MHVESPNTPSFFDPKAYGQLTPRLNITGQAEVNTWSIERLNESSWTQFYNHMDYWEAQTMQLWTECDAEEFI